MEAVHLYTIVQKDGEVSVRGLPYKKGEEIEIILLKTPTSGGLTAQQLSTSPIIGMWANRQMEESTQYARQLRERAQRR